MTDSNTDKLVLSSADLQAIISSAVAAALASQPKAEAPEAEPEAPKAKPKASKKRKPKLTAAKRAKARLRVWPSSLHRRTSLRRLARASGDLAKAKARRWEANPFGTFQSVEGVLKDAKPFREAITSLWEDGAFCRGG